MGLDEMIHAPGVGRQRRAVFGRQRDVRHLRDAPHAKPARIAVEFQGPRARDLREIASGQAPQPVHLVWGI